MNNIKTSLAYKSNLNRLVKSEMFRESPDCIKEKLLKYPPFVLYKYRALDKAIYNVIIYSHTRHKEENICEKCQIAILKEFNPTMILPERRVAGIRFEQLEPYDLVPNYRMPEKSIVIEDEELLTLEDLLEEYGFKEQHRVD